MDVGKSTKVLDRATAKEGGPSGIVSTVLGEANARVINFRQSEKVWRPLRQFYKQQEQHDE